MGVRTYKDLTAKEKEPVDKFAEEWNKVIREYNPEGKYTINRESLDALGKRLEENSKKFEIRVENWVADCRHKRIIIHQKGHKFAACNRDDEDLEKVIFDMEHKTISLVVKNWTLAADAPRVADLSNAVEFFNAIHEKIEPWLAYGFSSVTPNEDRTVFEVK